MTVVGSPFKCGGAAQRLPGGPCKRLTIRCDDTNATARVIIRIHVTEDVDATHASFFLNAGEALLIEDNSPANVTILDISDNPYIYWNRG